MREGWSYKKLGEVGSFLRGSGILKSDFVEDGCPCIHYGQIHTKFGVSVDSHLSEISETLFAKSKIANPGDIILAITSEDVEGSCKCIAWLGNYDVAVGAHAAIFKHNQNPKYLSYCFRSKDFGLQKAKYAHGFKVVEIKPSEVAEISIPIPPLTTQQQIVSELDLLSHILDQKRQQLKEYDALAESIFYDMFGEQVAKEKEWKTCTVGDIYKFQYGKGNKIPENKGDYPCYGSNGQVGFHVEYNSEDSPIIGHIGAYAGIVNWGAGKHYVTYNGVMCWLKNNAFDPVYGYYMLREQKYMEKASGRAAQPFVSYDILEAPKVFMPPLTLQRSFAAKIESIEHQKQLLRASIKETEMLFQSRMDYWFNN